MIGFDNLSSNMSFNQGSSLHFLRHLAKKNVSSLMNLAQVWSSGEKELIGVGYLSSDMTFNHCSFYYFLRHLSKKYTLSSLMNLAQV